MADKIIVLDFGSQYNQLISRRVREFGVYSELHPGDMRLSDILAMEDVKGIIFSGGPNSVYEDGSLKCDPAIFTSGLPILGICYGMQMIHQMLGGEVKGSDKKEYGRTEVIFDTNNALLKGLPEKQTVWMSHGDQVVKLADGFVGMGQSTTCPSVASMNEERKIYTLQFHPEVRHSEYGLDILKNFVFGVCEVKANWSMKNFIAQQIDEIRAKVGKDKVLLALSGGVDSSVVAALLHKAIGDQLYCMFIDHGLLRKKEADSVMETFVKNMSIHLTKVDASKRFMNKLKGVSDPEQKRKIIGNEFVYTFQDEVQKLLKGVDIHWLAQGTLYTDVIESGTKTAQTIKSHHNVGGLPEDLNFQLIEPLNKLFKDEVRALGTELGLPEEMVWRQPFPGPGLGIRVLGEISEEKLEIVRDSDLILREEIQKAGLQRDIWQYFTCLPNIRSVGVMGDQRTYDYTVVIRAVTSIDGMTADWARIPYDVLDRISTRIVNEVKHVNRVALDITSKPPGTIEWE
ncbi:MULTISPECIES: glutamine-hydrolyzing GMP synthase [Terrabacteria group]|uniref:glutamine-hydrolyzing GMP synthase n=1 Tax=Bacillati TaxID=1783272 RepID=UPI001C6E3CD3|nr:MULTISPECIES: glutamine-hydrolyzing GMP synthase [Terrabacteria group]MBW9212695.1 glutamine-hydrolyzing GMP synthase [Trueperella sp. zg.1013]